MREQPITKEMNISEILQKYPQTLNILIAHGFTPLKNPIMRMLMAKKVNVEQACKKKKLTQEEIILLLKDLNESALNPNFKPSIRKKEEEIKPDEIEINGEKFFDVRKLNPPNPLMFVTGRLNTMKDGEQINVVFKQRPIHLIQFLEEKKYYYEGVFLEDGSWKAKITKGGKKHDNKRYESRRCIKKISKDKTIAFKIWNV